MKLRATSNAFQIAQAMVSEAVMAIRRVDHGNGHSRIIFSHVECDAPDIDQVIFVDSAFILLPKFLVMASGFWSGGQLLTSGELPRNSRSFLLVFSSLGRAQRHS